MDSDDAKTLNEARVLAQQIRRGNLAAKVLLWDLLVRLGLEKAEGFLHEFADRTISRQGFRRRLGLLNYRMKQALAGVEWEDLPFHKEVCIRAEAVGDDTLDEDYDIPF